MIGYDRSIESFQHFIRDQSFPCVGARAALAAGGLNMVIAGDLRSDSHDKMILSELANNRYDMSVSSDFVSFAVIFQKTPILQEQQFEAI
jgi:FPC/CPF motif-containing protein YcgG